CVAGCPFDVPRISKKDNRAYKCTLCSDRVAVGQEPACVKTCPTGAIVFGTKEDMQLHAEERITDLKSRGFAQAGLYDPAGVGGTHVMYVLHHADQPGLYHGLPAAPSISPMVGLWKGLTKPLALAGIAVTALAGWFHYSRVGPNEVSRDEEAEAVKDANRIRESSNESR
ncbi:MAG TPA: formate dehydrogenase N subunit beta transmembrane domain-containing protein, partial [Burkholderiaceae bacterium]|nr:formate dehydrogenase N subunit beta transmembrane domain-containing protein [Burkholderiaceae bacterium]